MSHTFLKEDKKTRYECRKKLHGVLRENVGEERNENSHGFKLRKIVFTKKKQRISRFTDRYIRPTYVLSLPNARSQSKRFRKVYLATSMPFIYVYMWEPNANQRSPTFGLYCGLCSVYIIDIEMLSVYLGHTKRTGQICSISTPDKLYQY